MAKCIKNFKIVSCYHQVFQRPKLTRVFKSVAVVLVVVVAVVEVVGAH